MRFNLFSNLDLKQLINELSAGLQRLDFKNNFESFEVNIEVPDQTSVPGEFRLDNRLKPNVPTSMLIVKQIGNAVVTAGETAWTPDYIYIKNHSTTTSATLRIKFFK